MKKWELSILLGLMLAVFLTQFTSFAQTCDTVRSDTLRLHILANSDSAEDQACKLAVRDAILAQYGTLFSGTHSKEQAAQLASDTLPKMQQTALDTVQQEGYDYPVDVRLERMYFDTRLYENFTLPAGEYDAVRIEIGTASGKNWFCVMYPPLCVPAASDDAAMAVYSSREKEALTTPYTVKFAMLKWIQKKAK